ncbi:MAG: hypothetical protein AVDCRST_MAG87-4045, partial [uncultured Thermomicrobiales bacterium]
DRRSARQAQFSATGALAATPPPSLGCDSNACRPHWLRRRFG